MVKKKITQSAPSEKAALPSIVYVVRDIERALGKLPCENYGIVTNDSAYARTFAALYPDHIHLVTKGEYDIANSGTVENIDTHDMLSKPEVITWIHARKAAVVVFKNTQKIERLCKEAHLTLLNPSALLAEQIENKVTQIEWLGDLAKHLPPHWCGALKDVPPEWTKGLQHDIPFILQWAHGHTGDGTILIDNPKDFFELQKQFPARLVRIVAFVHGHTFTANILAETGAYAGVSYQITGLPPFTQNPWSTVGNDWGVGHAFFAQHDALRKKMEDLFVTIAEKMRNAGWKGLFGIDFIVGNIPTAKEMMATKEKGTSIPYSPDGLFLIEINARQPASVSFESYLQRLQREVPSSAKEVPKKTSTTTFTEDTEETTFEGHLRTLSCTLTETTEMGGAIKKPVACIPVTSGSQIVMRIDPTLQKIKSEEREEIAREIVANLTDATQSNNGSLMNAITYENDALNADFIRLQYKDSILNASAITTAGTGKSTDKLSPLGQNIRSVVAQKLSTSINTGEVLTVHKETLALIDAFLRLPFGADRVAVPYYNNKHRHIRAGLRAWIGKGTPEEILEEAELAALREKRTVKHWTPEEARQFLIEKDLGIDCSGLVFQLLEKESIASGGGHLGGLRGRLHWHGNLLRRIIARIRSTENASVAVLANPKNSKLVTTDDLTLLIPGDYFTITNRQSPYMRDHILFVYKIEKELGADGDITKPVRIHFIHSMAWPHDGKYGHGVRVGTITPQKGNYSLHSPTTTIEEVPSITNSAITELLQHTNVAIRRLL